MATEEEGNEIKDVSASDVKTENEQDLEIKPTCTRWIILGIYVLYSAATSFQFVEYSIITNVVIKYYNVSTVAVDWTGIMFMASYPILVFPATFIIDKYGLRVSSLIGCLCTTLGTIIKVFSIGKGLFYVVLIGQLLSACAQVIILSLPSRIATVWFKANEVSTACSIGVLGATIGQAAGFIIPPLIVKNRKSIEETEYDFKILCWGLAIFMIPVLLIVIFYFPSHPKHPPNASQIEERQNEREVTFSQFYNSVKLLMANKGFVLHLISYSINIATTTSFITLLNQFILSFFPDSQKDAGQMGLVMIVVGVVSSLITGIILDKTHKYKECVVFLGIMSIVGLITFNCALEYQAKTWSYVTISIVGWFFNAYLLAGLELGVELTFPLPEGTTMGILLALSQMLAAVNTLIAGKLLYSIGAFWTLFVQAGCILVAVLLSVFVPNDLRRQKVFIEHSCNYDFIS